MSTIKLADALLRRKELAEKVQLLKRVDQEALYEVRAKRVNVTDSVDDFIANVPVLTAGQVTHEHDWHARQLRLVDAAIQQANWNTDIEVADSVMNNYQPPGIPAEAE